VIIVQQEILFLLLIEVRVKGNTPVDELVLTALVSLKGFAADLFLTIYQAILVTMMIEVNFADTSVNLDDLLPIVRGSRAVIVLN
jgi:hypothetical protein